MIINYKRLGKKSRLLRKQEKLSLNVAAKKMGLLKGSLGNIERADKHPSLELLVLLADFYMVSVDALLDRPSIYNG